jgi:hypothetical protein
MSRLLAILLLAVYLCSLVTVAVPYLSYLANYSYISTTLCENKDKPWLKCNGHCYLMKMIALEEEAAERATDRLSPRIRPIESLYLVAVIAPEFPVTTDAPFPLVIIAPCRTFSGEPLFHPPIA